MKVCRNCIYFREMKPKTENSIVYVPAGVCDFWLRQTTVVDYCMRFIKKGGETERKKRENEAGQEYTP